MKLNIIYLAAGFGSRFGVNKLLYQIDGKPMYRHTLDRLLRLMKDMDMPCKLIVVTQYDEVEDDVKAYCLSLDRIKKENEILVVRNEHSERGISSSLQCGLLADDNAEAYLCCVADQPYLKEETLRNFLKHYMENSRGIGCISHGGGYGNPVIFAAKYREELLKLKGDQGGKQIFRSHLNDIMLFEVTDAHELADIDLLSEIPKAD